nr:hypothetical protein BHE74_00022651 [Ipomoea trifida]
MIEAMMEAGDFDGMEEPGEVSNHSQAVAGFLVSYSAAEPNPDVLSHRLARVERAGDSGILALGLLLEKLRLGNGGVDALHHRRESHLDNLLWVVNVVNAGEAPLAGDKIPPEPETSPPSLETAPPSLETAPPSLETAPPSLEPPINDKPGRPETQQATKRIFVGNPTRLDPVITLQGVQCKVTIPRSPTFGGDEPVDVRLHDDRPGVLLPRPPEVHFDGRIHRFEGGVGDDVAVLEDEGADPAAILSPLGGHHAGLVPQWLPHHHLAVLEDRRGVPEDEVDGAGDGTIAVVLAVRVGV